MLKAFFLPHCPFWWIISSMRFVTMPLVFLVGCVGEHQESSAADSSHDSSIDTSADSIDSSDSSGDSTGDTAHDSSVDTPPCDLLHPWAMDTVEDVGLAAALVYPNIAILTLLNQNAVTGAKNAVNYGDACPTVTESDDGTTVTVTGDCTTSWDQVYGGTATFTNTDSDYTSVYDHFHFEDDPGSWGYEVDGTWSFSWVDRTFEVDLTLTMLGEWIPGLPEVTATYQTTGSDRLIEGYADIVSQPTNAATGDVCVSDDYEYVSACDAEADEVVSLWGSTPATLTWNGSTSCDGCADVTIDGADAGTYCP